METTLDVLKASNKERFQKLAEKGLVLPISQVTALQLAALVELLPPETRERWSRLFEGYMADAFGKMEEQLAESEHQDKLYTPPGARPSGLVLP